MADDNGDGDGGIEAPHLTVIDGGAASDPPKAKRRKLTSKQERFLAALIRNDGGSLSDCYREAYDTSRMSSAAIHNESSLLAGHHEVARRLALHQASIERSAQTSALSRRRFVLEGLEREATQADSDSARVQALIALGKTSGVDLFSERIESVTDQSPAEVRDELERRLVALLGKTG